MPTVLLITPYFPPMSVVGAKRPLNLVRHLPRFGWQPVVLAGDPAGENVDLGLADLIPADLPVSYAYGEGKQASSESALRPREKERRFLGWDAGYITPFDRYLWHNGAALREAAHLIEKHRPSAVVVCADPWSPLLVGVKLAHSPGLPLVVDFRDPWSLQRAKMALRPPPTRWIIRQTEYRVFRTARRIVLNTEECHDAYTAAYRGASPRSASPAYGTPSISESSRTLRFSGAIGSRYFTSGISAGWFLPSRCSRASPSSYSAKDSVRTRQRWCWRGLRERKICATLRRLVSPITWRAVRQSPTARRSA